MKPQYSIWLMPAAPDAAELQALVDELAPQFGQPAFVPHVTIQGDLDLPLDVLVGHVRGLAAAWPVQTWPVGEVERSDFFFRCLYLRFAVHAAFDGLQRQAQASTGTAEGLSPYPHLSLAYGQVQPGQGALVEALRARFRGRRLVFDHLSVCLSSKHTPIADWACVFDAPLKSATARD
ncbi:hypothetical protein RD110_03805 [Rhodoferax koreense]|uniref:2'-5' RNA ligase n=1 Tax=Rhodoferax koreensis TaxID=1842727 RepID=A0A1P8JRR9_9BURK|nr:hypothetical protein [Rhodoferax koreense]APW36431.1 hypothetical protein RD110_03805 [Rhodoferax koreense]